MKDKKIKILLFISSQSTPRIYLALLKKYLQEKMPNVIINYFISSHDEKNYTLKKSVYTELEKLKKDVDIFIGLDGYLPNGLLKYVKGKNYLVYLPEVGHPSNISDYVKGYENLIVFDEKEKDFFERKCRKKDIEVVWKEKDPFGCELKNSEEIENARKELEGKFPQIVGKRILSITIRGTCQRQYVNKFKNINLKQILKKLPDDVVLMTNCPEIEFASLALPRKYVEKYIMFRQKDMLNVLMVSEWNYTNIGLAEKTAAKIKRIFYSGNNFEKIEEKECIKLWANCDGILKGFNDLYNS